jgi:hypothetical protein
MFLLTDFECGCLCLECCDWVPPAANATAASSSSPSPSAAPAPYEWRCYNATESQQCSPYSECK